MKIVSTLMAFFVATFCVAQVKHDSSSTEVIKQIIDTSNNKEILLYTRDLSPHFYQYYKDKLNKKSLIFFNHYQTRDTLILTKKEKRYIIQQLAITQKYDWEENVFPNSKIIAQDTLWDYLSKNDRTVVHQFSKPICIREDSICLVYYMRFIGVGGPSYFGFYKKINGIWKEWISISSGYLN